MPGYSTSPLPSCEESGDLSTHPGAGCDYWRVAVAQGTAAATRRTSNLTCRQGVSADGGRVNGFARFAVSARGRRGRAYSFGTTLSFHQGGGHARSENPVVQ